MVPKKLIWHWASIFILLCRWPCSWPSRCSSSRRATPRSSSSFPPEAAAISSPRSCSALVVDYMLTITISIASSADALFSFLPIELQPLKIFTQIALIFALIFLNLRGVKESVLFLLPIFLLFIVMHAFGIALGIGEHVGNLPGVVAKSYTEMTRDFQSLGILATLGILLHAYS